MVKILDSFPKKVNGGVYPWDEWLDGKPREFKRNEDFKIKSLSFAQAAYSAAKRRGCKLNLRVLDDNTVVIQKR